MKNAHFFLVVMGFLLILNSCASSKTLNYPQPEFDKPFIYIFDAFQIRGNHEHFIILQNASNDSNINFNVYVHDPRSKTKTWELVELGHLGGNGDTCRLRNKELWDIDNYRYFAVESLNRKAYRYVVTKDHNDLIISILDE